MNNYLGQIGLFGFGFVPWGWMPCDGRLLSIQEYRELFALLGVSFGGNGRTTFALPDLRGRAIMHVSDTKVGHPSGSEGVTLSTAQVPAHTHEACGMADPGDQTSPVNNFWATAPFGVYAPAGGADTTLAEVAVTTAGQGLSHENRQPYLTLNYCIACKGEFPPPE